MLVSLVFFSFGWYIVGFVRTLFDCISFSFVLFYEGNDSLKTRDIQTVLSKYGLGKHGPLLLPGGVSSAYLVHPHAIKILSLSSLLFQEQVRL